MENKTQNSFVLLCPGTFLNGVCVVCVLYIFFQSGTDESLGQNWLHLNLLEKKTKLDLDDLWFWFFSSETLGAGNH